MDPWDDLRRGCSNPRPTSALVRWITFAITVRGWSAGHAPAVDRAPEMRSGTEPRFPTKPYVISTGAVLGRELREFGFFVSMHREMLDAVIGMVSHLCSPRRAATTRYRPPSRA